MPQYEYTHPVAFNGQIATGDPRAVASYINELLAQETEVAIGGTDDGTYTVRITGEEGIFDISYVASSKTADQIADGLAAAFLADVDMVNIVDASSTSGTPLELDFLHPGRVYAIAYPSNPGTNMTTSVVQAAGGTDINLGVCVVQGTAANEAVAPGAGSTAPDCLGVVVRSMETQVNEGLSTEIDVVSPGGVISVLQTGEVWVNVEDAVTANAPCFMRIQNAGVGQFLGGIRSDVDTANAVEIPGMRFRTSTTGAGLARVAINLFA